MCIYTVYIYRQAEYGVEVSCFLHSVISKIRELCGNVDGCRRGTDDLLHCNPDNSGRVISCEIYFKGHFPVDNNIVFLFSSYTAYIKYANSITMQICHDC